MEGRQNGAAMADFMKESENFPASQAIVVDAYKRPRFGSESYQESAISDFSNRWYLACYESRNK